MHSIGGFTCQHFAPVLGTPDKAIFKDIDASRVAPIEWICHINSISKSLDKSKISIVFKKEVCAFPCLLYPHQLRGSKERRQSLPPITMDSIPDVGQKWHRERRERGRVRKNCPECMRQRDRPNQRVIRKSDNWPRSGASDDFFIGAQALAGAARG